MRSGSWFSGTANAIYQNIGFIESYDPDNVLILSGDHIYKMDYSDMLREHIEQDAACTISVLQVSMEEATRFGIMNLGEDGYINEFEEKPKQPKSDLASMGIYIFNWKKLREYLIADENDPNSDKDFGKNIIPNMLAAGEKLWPYRFKRLLARRRHHHEPLGREHGYALAHAHQPLRPRLADQRAQPYMPAALRRAGTPR